MIIMTGIDGTGTPDNTKYALEFKVSNVNRAVRGWRDGPATYLRGPTDLGLETKALAATAFNIVHLQRCLAGAQKTGVFLTGYSRGAAAAIEACWMLHERSIEVDCLLLFDAVDRTHTLSERVDCIPPNVRACYHAIRDPAALSREWMGNCGRKVRGQTTYQEQSFFCTHGAVGGTPWNKPGRTGGGFIEEDVGVRGRYQVQGSVAGNVASALAHLVLESSVVRTKMTPLMDNRAAWRVWCWAEKALKTELANCQARLRGQSSVGWRSPASTGESYYSRGPLKQTAQ